MSKVFQLIFTPSIKLSLKTINSRSESTEQSEYIDMDDYSSLPTPPSPSNMSPAECPYMGLPFVHLKLNKSVLIVQENTKITGRKVTVTCALLKGCWLLYYHSNKPNALKPDKSFQVDHLEVPTSPEQALQLTLFCCQDPPQTLHFESGTMREMWIKAIREELPILEDGVYDDPNNLRMDEHLYKTIKFDYDIPKMPPKPVDGQQQQHQQQQQEPRQNQRMSPNADFQLKCQVISEQLDSQLKNQKGGVTAIERRQRSNSIISPQKKFGLFMFNMFRSTTSSGSNSPPMQEVSASNHPKKTTPEKTAKILKCKRNTTIFSPDYEIVGS